ncbi:hypothetical protein Ocin01_16826 [Orchesella cincta]|uniref:YqaJ viral recombinase domain-containing protein n=1 Tax=Orchesella cincta TaxID=48709 RepID=A0A1D2MA43_ORCCI|nr:hypothetical protein Ocin01_16826 [Orchesella cincta]
MWISGFLGRWRLAVSPDGKVGDEGLIEVKCPLTLKDKKILDWAIERRSQSPVVVKDGVLMMKTEHAHYFQVVMQIFVAERQWCDYFIWSETGDHFLQRVIRDSKTTALWNRIKSKLIHFWELDLLPELADSRLERKLKPRLPEYRQLAIKVKKSGLARNT